MSIVKAANLSWSDFVTQAPDYASINERTCAEYKSYGLHSALAIIQSGMREGILYDASRLSFNAAWRMEYALADGKTLVVASVSRFGQVSEGVPTGKNDTNHNRLMCAAAAEYLREMVCRFVQNASQPVSSSALEDDHHLLPGSIAQRIEAFYGHADNGNAEYPFDLGDGLLGLRIGLFNALYGVDGSHFPEDKRFTQLIHPRPDKNAFPFYTNKRGNEAVDLLILRLTKGVPKASVIRSRVEYVSHMGWKFIVRYNEGGSGEVSIYAVQQSAIPSHTVTKMIIAPRKKNFKVSAYVVISGDEERLVPIVLGPDNYEFRVCFMALSAVLHDADLFLSERKLTRLS